MFAAFAATSSRSGSGKAKSGSNGSSRRFMRFLIVRKAGHTDPVNIIKAYFMGSIEVGYISWRHHPDNRHRSRLHQGTRCDADRSGRHIPADLLGRADRQSSSHRIGEFLTDPTTTQTNSCSWRRCLRCCSPPSSYAGYRAHPALPWQDGPQPAVFLSVFSSA